MKALYKTKDQFGNKTYLPACEIAQGIADIAGTKTLRMADMVVAEDSLAITWQYVPS